LDTIEDQDKDIKLFETIALSTLGDKELKRVSFFKQFLNQ
jgi:hypothetical protein